MPEAGPEEDVAFRDAVLIAFRTEILVEVRSIVVRDIDLLDELEGAIELLLHSRPSEIAVVRCDEDDIAVQSEIVVLMEIVFVVVHRQELGNDMPISKALAVGWNEKAIGIVDGVQTEETGREKPGQTERKKNKYDRMGTNLSAKAGE